MPFYRFAISLSLVAGILGLSASAFAATDNHVSGNMVIEHGYRPTPPLMIDHGHQLSPPLIIEHGYQPTPPRVVDPGPAPTPPLVVDHGYEPAPPNEW